MKLWIIANRMYEYNIAFNIAMYIYNSFITKINLKYIIYL